MGKITTQYTNTTDDLNRLENNFKYHAPKGDQQERYIELRNKAKELATMYMNYVPPSRERSVALTSLEDSNMWANAGIARNE